jgi:hypothetical protein
MTLLILSLPDHGWKVDCHSSEFGHSDFAETVRDDAMRQSLKDSVIGCRQQFNQHRSSFTTLEDCK